VTVAASMHLEPLECPAGCPSRKEHEAYFRAFAQWKAKLPGERAPTEPSDPHSPDHPGAGAASHEEGCLLTFGCRSLLAELATGMAEVLKISPESLLSRVEVHCVEKGGLVCQTRMRAGGARNRIELSHGFHFFCLNASVLVLAAQRRGTAPAGGPAPANGPDLAGLFAEQLSYFWTQSPAEALLFPYWEFDAATYAAACELAFLMIAFLMAHELSHSALLLSGIERATIDDVEANARRFLDVIPPPFLDGEASHPKWKEDWREELVCDGLAMWSLLLCAPGAKQALAGAPEIGARASSDRYLAFEALTHHVEMLYLCNTMAGKTKALVALYSPTHPLPNIRRTFLRGLAEQVDRNFVTKAALYAAAMRQLN
jgi:hypothetical protein